MTKRIVYLDHNATSPMRPEVWHAWEQCREDGGLDGNPSSVHELGRAARKSVEQARQKVAQSVGADAINVTFCSGATEANNAVILGTSAQHIIVSEMEHPAVIEAVQARSDDKNAGGVKIHIIPSLDSGAIDTEAVEDILATIPSTEAALVSCMWVNNETGVIQPIDVLHQHITACRQDRKAPVWLHVDAVQALGRLPVDIRALPIDYLVLSAHKIGGPKGIGALVYDHEKPQALGPMTWGGGQERRRRAGTENVMGIIGFGAAAEAAVRDMTPFQNMATWRKEAEKTMLDTAPHAIVFGDDAPRVANTIQIALPNIRAETQLMRMDLAGIAVSSGSACSSGSIKPSHVLRAMGVVDDIAMGALRLSFGWNTTKEDVDRAVAAWCTMAKELGSVEI